MTSLICLKLRKRLPTLLFKVANPQTGTMNIIMLYEGWHPFGNYPYIPYLPVATPLTSNLPQPFPFYL